MGRRPLGILGAAPYDPLWRSAIFTSYDFALASIGFVLLTVWKAPPWTVVVLLAGGAVGLGWKSS
jgi:chromate transporter